MPVFEIDTKEKINKLLILFANEQDFLTALNDIDILFINIDSFILNLVDTKKPGDLIDNLHQLKVHLNQIETSPFFVSIDTFQTAFSEIKILPRALLALLNKSILALQEYSSCYETYLDEIEGKSLKNVADMALKTRGLIILLNQLHFELQAYLDENNH